MHKKRLGYVSLLAPCLLWGQEPPSAAIPPSVSNNSAAPSVSSAATANHSASVPAVTATTTSATLPIPADVVPSQMPHQADTVMPLATRPAPNVVVAPNVSSAAPIQQPVREAVPAESPVASSSGLTEQQPEHGQSGTIEPSAVPTTHEQPTSPIQPLAAPDENEIQSIDNTVSISEGKGNWLYKRIWWEKAERLYEKTKQMADKILESRISFFAQKTEMDRLLQEFYVNIGMQQGELVEATRFLTEQAQQQPAQNLSDNKQKIMAVLADQKKNLQTLQSSTIATTKIENAVDDALMKLNEQLNLVKQYEQQSWQAFKEINKEFNDKRARELYYAMDTYWKNINSINAYLSDPFYKYFTQLTQKLQHDTETIKETMRSLNEMGINIKTDLGKLQQDDIPPAQPQQETEESKGFFARVYSWVTYPFSALWHGITSLFSGESQEEVVALPKRSRTERAASENE